MIERTQTALFGEGKLYGDNRSTISFSENGRTFRAQNRHKKSIEAYHVDGKAVNSGARCDYALVIPLENNIYLIELKGKDLGYAAGQISATLETLKQKIAGCKVFGRIVLSRVQVPDIKTIPVITCQKKLRDYQGDLKYKAVLLEEQI